MTPLQPTGRLRTWIAGNPIPAVTLAGLMLYGSLRLANGIFYYRLGFRPEEVGLGYAETISGAVGLLVFFATGRIMAGFLAVFLAALVGVLWPRRGHGRPSFFTELNKTAGQEIVRFGKLSGFLLLVLFALATPVIYALLRAPLAPDGIETRPAFDLTFRAEAAIVHTDTSAYGLANGSCILYLGQSDGILALYDPASGTSWRMPASATAVETGEALDNVERVPGDCPDR
jgi:hypothetical protein